MTRHDVLVSSGMTTSSRTPRRPATTVLLVVGLVLAASCSPTGQDEDGPVPTSVPDADTTTSAPVTTTGQDAVGAGAFEPITEMLRETVEFASVDIPGDLWEPLRPDPSTGEPVTITARLTVPPTDGPVGAVVMAHGCSGVGATSSEWVRILGDAGYATLEIDSFRPRGVTQICSGSETVSIPSILGDAFRAADMLRRHPAIDPDAIAVMGFSFGGRTAMWTARNDYIELLGGEPFAAHLAFYPTGCFIRLADEADLADVPIRIFHGTADDWLPIEDCLEMADRLRPAGVDIEVIPYEGGHHAFDVPSALGLLHYETGVSPRNCDFREVDGTIVDITTGEPAAVATDCVERGVTIGFDRGLWLQAIDDVTTFLTETIGPPS